MEALGLDPLPAAALGLGAVYILARPREPYPLHVVLKAAPVLVLAAWVNQAGPRAGPSLAVPGLLLSAAGDVLLAMERYYRPCFLLGLAAFLLAHVAYATGFWRSTDWAGADPGAHAPAAAGALAYGLGFGAFLYPRIPKAIRAPCYLYVAAIVAMVLSALNVGGPHHADRMRGVLLFLASDSLLAVNRFVGKLKYEGPLVMGTYYAAQYYIAKAALPPCGVLCRVADAVAEVVPGWLLEVAARG